MTPGIYQQSPSGMQSSDLPPDAASMLAGGYPDTQFGSPMGGGGDANVGGGQGPNPGGGGIPGFGMTGSTGAGPGAMSDPSMGGGMGDGQMIPGQVAGAQGADPMMEVKNQFDQVTGALQLLAQSYPMATEELQEAGTALARAMLKIASAVQPSPMTPPIPA